MSKSSAAIVVISVLVLTSNSFSEGPPLRLIPIPGEVYTGVYADFGDREDNVTLDGLENYEQLVARQQALIGFSSDWGLQTFPSKQLRVISNYGAVPLIYWSPWDRPLGAPRAQNRFHLKKILNGEWDAYIDDWARKAKEHGEPMLVSWGLEMNGQWFPWSGYFYGAGSPWKDGKYQGPETYKAAYRYVVDRVRRQGADNIAWVFHANNTSDPEESWNQMSNYYPGRDYVDWLGMSAYGMQYPEQGWAPVSLVFDKPYRDLTALDPELPLVLAEWGIGEFPHAGSKAQWLGEFFRRLPIDFSRIRAGVYWHERWQNGDLRYSNLRANSSPEALRAFRNGSIQQYWRDRPVLAPASDR